MLAAIISLIMATPPPGCYHLTGIYRNAVLAPTRTATVSARRTRCSSMVVPKGRSRNVHGGDRKEARIGQVKAQAAAAVKRPRRSRRNRCGGVTLAKGKAPGANQETWRNRIGNDSRPLEALFFFFLSG
jgi:hypothetical protein